MSNLSRNVVQISGTILAASAAIARNQRQTASLRQQGIWGLSTAVLPVGPNSSNTLVEYSYTQPNMARQSAQITAILEHGLGEPTTVYYWLHKLCARSGMGILTYHRPGYGRTSTSAEVRSIVPSLLSELKIDGPLVLVSHSIGSIALSSWMEAIPQDRVHQILLLDPTDPILFDKQRSSAKLKGKFFQQQIHHLIASISGIVNWGPNYLDRQVAFPPDPQFDFVQFVNSPKTICSALREYLNVDVSAADTFYASNPRVTVISSKENQKKQIKYASRLKVVYGTVEQSNHISMLGHQEYAEEIFKYIFTGLADEL